MSCGSNARPRSGRGSAAIKVIEAGGTPTPEPSPVVSPAPPLSNEPAPVSPVGFAGMASVAALPLAWCLPHGWNAPIVAFPGRQK